MLSCRLAPVKTMARGRPLRSTTMCLLVPGLPRSVGFGPISSPPFLPGPSRHPRWHATSGFHRQGSGVSACGDGFHPTRRHPARRAAGASRSSRSIRPPRRATVPKRPPCTARTGCRSAPCGSPPEAARPLGGGGAAGSREAISAHRASGKSVLPCQSFAQIWLINSFVRRSKHLGWFAEA